MSNSLIRVGLIGCGAVSELYYTPALKDLERLGLICVNALFDPSNDSAAKLQQNFSRANRITDFSWFSAQTIDLAIVASPPQYHASQTIQLLKARVSVLCEKPMASTVAEARAMIDAAEESEGLLAIGLFRRFFPATQAIHHLISSGMLGEIQSFECYEGGIFQWPIKSPAYFARSSAKGGVLLDIGVHVLDLLFWWFGEPVDINYEDDAMGGIDVNCRLECQFENFTGIVKLSRDCTLPNRHIIWGSKGWLSWTANESDNIEIGFANSNLGINGKIHYSDLNSTLPKLVQSGLNFQQSFTSQICNVVAAMQGKENLMIPGTEGILSLKWIEYCYQHRTLMSQPWLSPAEIDSAQQSNINISD